MSDVMKIAIAQLREELARVEGEKAELEAALLNERGEGAPPSEGWEWDGEAWRKPGFAVTRYNRGNGWEILTCDADGSATGSPFPYDDKRGAREAMRQADAAMGAS